MPSRPACGDRGLPSGASLFEASRFGATLPRIMKRQLSAIFGGRAAAESGPIQTFDDTQIEPSMPAAPNTVTEANTGPAQFNISSDELLDSAHEPILVLDGGGNIVTANAAARALFGERDTVAGVSRTFGKIQLLNGGGTPPWIPSSTTGDYAAFVGSSKPSTAEPIFELRTTARNPAQTGKTGWIVRLVEVTPLVAALRARSQTTEHLNQLLKLMSHDMRTPMVAILTTLKHPDLSAMPPAMHRIIEKAASRALHMIDYNARLIRVQTTDYIFSPVNIAHILEDVIDGAWALTKSVGAKIELKHTDCEQFILADRGTITAALSDVCTQMLNGSGKDHVIEWVISAANLDERPAATVSVREIFNPLDGRDRSSGSRHPASRLGGEITQPFENDGLAFLKSVVARHSGATTLTVDPSFGRVVSVTIPTVDPAELLP